MNARPAVSKGQPSLEDVLKALGDPVRLHIVMLAAHDERACNQFGLSLPKATLSHHFSVLHKAGIIERRVVGTRHLTRVRKQELEKRFPGLLKSVLSAAEQGPPCPKATKRSKSSAA